MSAQGDGVTDDTAAINNAILSGGRCGRLCTSSTLTPAVVYFPAGTYLVSSPIIDQYLTNLIGDPTNLPTIKATSGFNGIALIDGDTYYGDNNPNDPNWISTNVFYRQVRNFKIDMTSIPASAPRIDGIHWPTAQATSLQNIVITMSTASGNQQVGLFIENGMLWHDLRTPDIRSPTTVWTATSSHMSEAFASGPTPSLLPLLNKS